MKQILLAIFLVFFTLSCGEQFDSKTSTQISFTTAALSAGTVAGGMIFYAFGPRPELNFSKIISSDQVDIVVENGDWTFAVIAWEGPNNLEGDTRCDLSVEKLIGGAQDISFDLTKANCDQALFSPSEGISTSEDFNTLNFVSCSDLGGLVNASSTCTGSAGPLKSFKVSLSEFHQGVLGSSLLSNCIPYNNTAGSQHTSNLRLPSGGGNRSHFKMKVFAYTTTACTSNVSDEIFDFPLGPHRVNFEVNNRAKFFFGTNSNTLFLD